MIEFGPRMRFHHPLMRSAAYRAAELTERRAAAGRAQSRAVCPPRPPSSSARGATSNLAVVLDGEVTPAGRPMGRALAESTFHHFADYNWDLDRGAPSFVSEPPGTQIKADPTRLAVYKDYIRNIATWLQPTTSHHPSPVRRAVQPV